MNSNEGENDQGEGDVLMRIKGKRYRIRPDRMEKYKAAAYLIFAIAVFGGFAVAFVYGWATGLMAW